MLVKTDAGIIINHEEVKSSVTYKEYNLNCKEANRVDVKNGTVTLYNNEYLVYSETYRDIDWVTYNPTDGWTVRAVNKVDPPVIWSIAEKYSEFEKEYLGDFREVIIGSEEGCKYNSRNHEYVDVGFMQSKFVCKKCDKDKT